MVTIVGFVSMKPALLIHEIQEERPRNVLVCLPILDREHVGTKPGSNLAVHSREQC